MIGRALVGSGEIVFVITLDSSGQPKLIPAGNFDVIGGPDPEVMALQDNNERAQPGRAPALNRPQIAAIFFTRAIRNGRGGALPL